MCKELRGNGNSTPESDLFREYYELVFSIQTRHSNGNREDALRKSKELLILVYKIEDTWNKITSQEAVYQLLTSLKIQAYRYYGHICLEFDPRRALWGFTRAREVLLTRRDTESAECMCEILSDMSAACARIGDDAKEDEIFDEIHALRSKVRYGFSTDRRLTFALVDFDCESDQNTERLKILDTGVENETDRRHEPEGVALWSVLRCMLTFHHEGRHDEAQKYAAHTIDLMNDDDFDFYSSIEEVRGTIRKRYAAMCRHRDFCKDPSCKVLTCISQLEKYLTSRK